MAAHCERAPINLPGPPPVSYRGGPLAYVPPPAMSELFLHEGTVMPNPHPTPESHTTPKRRISSQATNTTMRRFPMSQLDRLKRPRFSAAPMRGAALG